MEAQPIRNRLGYWPWLVLALTTLPAFWYVVDFERSLDPEFPNVARQTYNPYPPAAYRLAVAGDTIDHAAVYVASAAVVLSVWSCLRDPKRRLRYAALALSLAAFWHAATPGPLMNGWHGLGWRTIFDPRVATGQRLALAGLAMLVAIVVVWCSRPWTLPTFFREARDSRILALLLVAVVLLAVRQTSWIDREPFEFWPRWFYVWGLFAWSFALLRVTPPAPPGWTRRAAVAGLIVAWLGLDFLGRGIFWYQRPINRLHEIVPGKLYLSAMPTYQGLKIAQERHHFKTIVNLFPEYTEMRSPHWPDEQRFAREHGIACYNQPAADPTGEQFVKDTLALAQDPNNWPLLVHCHGSMDRSPAWVGMYRFVVDGWPLNEAIKELERHRGLRPKSSVTLLYNRMLPMLAPERAATDPTAAQLRVNARGTVDPAEEIARRAETDAQQSGETSATQRR
ncbi:hypothetical protein [Paludisphaera borealis]|uniref:Tyrosine specific protein phosphatases domain-containing protein n=1 Tax=Paludisphaera borealis TaxID=1387353 RepID=A0A1U7CZ04_9BACT|nr:hypothetical protein [Paludisphaera borealis]APW64187.1 hypothetical protein BSF38_05779 [Paludisphaera borealis]